MAGPARLITLNLGSQTIGLAEFRAAAGGLVLVDYRLRETPLDPETGQRRDAEVALHETGAVLKIDRGLHPRLLRHLQDALYRLSYPESCGETRPAIQVIATTHSPYLLDLYRERPEEVVLARKEGLEVEMKRLSDIEHFDDILGDSPLSEVWYSGVLGGVSVKP